MNHTLLSSARIPATPAWRRWLRQPVGRGHWRRWPKFLALLYTLLAFAGLYNYLTLVSATTAIGILALLYTPRLEKHPPETFRFGWVALFFIALFFLVPVTTTVYLALGCAACLLLETFHRRIERTVPFILLLLTPITDYFAGILSFPIRLQLTALAGRLLSLSGLPIAVAGNSITFRDHAFSVDPACDGLHLLVVSAVAALLLMNYYQSHFRRRLRTGSILLLLLLTAALNILANLLRIICLVALAILPGNPLHSALGLLFLLVYILLPLVPAIRWTIRRWGTSTPEERTGYRPTRSRALLLGNLLIGTGVLLLVLLHFRMERTVSTGLATVDSIPGYKIKEVEGKVLQLDNVRSLVYIKPIPGFYYTDHTPTICWQGSGYTFSSLQETTTENTRIFEGILEPQHPSTSAFGFVDGQDSARSGDHRQLYTAWWYDNGIRQTTGPIDWRWDLIRGAPPYSVINITTATREELAAELALALKTHPFRRLLGRPSTQSRVKIW